MAKKVRSLSDLTPDIQNANEGTERGRYMLETSLRETGAGRSIVVDVNGNIIAGNKTYETWAEIGDPGAVEVIETDGTKLVVVKRIDLDLNDPTGPARQMAYLDNRTSEVGLRWNFDVLKDDVDRGVDFGKFFSPLELHRLGLLRTNDEKISSVDDADDLLTRCRYGSSRGDGICLKEQVC